MNWLVEKYERWQEQRIASQAKRFQEYEKSIEKLFRRSEDGCKFSIVKTQIKLENRARIINLIGSGVIVFAIQAILAGIALIYGTCLSLQFEQKLPSSYLSFVWFLIFGGVFCALIFCIIYGLMLSSLRADRIKFEIQNRKINELVETVKK